MNALFHRLSKRKAGRTSQRKGEQEAAPRKVRSAPGELPLSPAAATQPLTPGSSHRKRRNRFRWRKDEITILPEASDEELPRVIETREDEGAIAQQATSLDQQAQQHMARGEYAEAFVCYNQSLQLKRRHVDQNESVKASLATSLHNVTYLKQQSGQATLPETMAAYLSSLQTKKEILGPHHVSVGRTLNNIGSVFYLQKEYAPALKAYLDALDIMEQQLGSMHDDVGTVQSNVGDVYYAMGKRGEALDFYRRSLGVRWKHLGPGDPKVVRIMELIATLETGRQPRKKEGELSDSEDEEYAEEDRRKSSEYNDELKDLQQGLEEDLKYFDLLERQMAIDMVKDKTRIFREMRDIQSDSANVEESGPMPTLTDETVDDSSASEHAESTILSVRRESLASSTDHTESKRLQPLYTETYRQAALTSVKDRLQKLRAEREAREVLEPPKESQNGSTRRGSYLASLREQQTKRSSLMNPTIASASKVRPVRLFVDKSDHHRMQQGMHTLRGVPTQHTS